jgi:hypothetical protein
MYSVQKTVFQVTANYRTSITIPKVGWARVRDTIGKSSVITKLFQFEARNALFVKIEILKSFPLSLVKIKDFLPTMIKICQL